MRVGEVLIFQLDEERGALRLDDVVEVVASVEHLPLPDAPEVVLGLIDVRGQVATLYDMRARLGLERRLPSVSDHFILCHGARGMVAICVDRAIEIGELSGAILDDAGRLPPSSPFVAGVARLADDMLLIYDLAKFLTSAEEQTLARALTKDAGTRI